MSLFACQKEKFLPVSGGKSQYEVPDEKLNALNRVHVLLIGEDNKLQGLEDHIILSIRSLWVSR